MSDLSKLLEQLDAARANATPGEWYVAASGGIDAGDYDTVIGRGDVDCMAYCYGGTSTIQGDNLDADAALIVAAVNALPRLTVALRAIETLADGWGHATDEAGSPEPRFRYCADRLHDAIAAAMTPEDGTR